MPEIRTSGSMSGDGKRGVGHTAQATAPILDSTELTGQPTGRARQPDRVFHTSANLAHRSRQPIYGKPVVAALVWSATMCRSRSTPSII